MDLQTDLWHYYMGLALEDAQKSYHLGEVPVGAIVLSKDGKLIGRGHNLKEKTLDSTNHAEIIALKQASQELGDWRLNDCTLITTLEPCFMCLGALLNFRIKNIVFGAYDPKMGPLSLGYHFTSDARQNHHPNIFGGIRQFECAKLLSNFFKERRQFY